MLHNLISADMKVYALQLNTNPLQVFLMEFCKILEQLLWRIIFGAASEKKTEEEKDTQ